MVGREIGTGLVRIFTGPAPIQAPSNTISVEILCSHGRVGNSGQIRIVAPGIPRVRIKELARFLFSPKFSKLRLKVLILRKQPCLVAKHGGLYGPPCSNDTRAGNPKPVASLALSVRKFETSSRTCPFHAIHAVLSNAA